MARTNFVKGTDGEAVLSGVPDTRSAGRTIKVSTSKKCTSAICYGWHCCAQFTCLGSPSWTKKSCPVPKLTCTPRVKVAGAVRFTWASKGDDYTKVGQLCHILTSSPSWKRSSAGPWSPCLPNQGSATGSPMLQFTPKRQGLCQTGAVLQVSQILSGKGVGSSSKDGGFFSGPINRRDQPALGGGGHQEVLRRRDVAIVACSVEIFVSARAPKAERDSKEGFDHVGLIWLWFKIEPLLQGPQVLALAERWANQGKYGCGSKPTVPFWGRCTTHFVYFSWDWDVCWGLTRVLTHSHMNQPRVDSFWGMFPSRSHDSLTNPGTPPTTSGQH